MIFHSDNGRVEYDFALSPHADPRQIRIAWTAPARQTIQSSGDLEVRAGTHTLICGKPALFQHGARGRIDIPGRFTVDAKAGEARFEVGRYDPDLPLTIDPTLEVAAFLGGEGNDRVTATLNGLVAGVTDSAHLIGFGSRGSGRDVFIWDGRFYTVYGGSGDEEPTAIALAGRTPVLVGWTSSRDFPLIGSRSFQPTFGGGNTDGFLIVAPGAGANGYSSYLGGSGDDRILAVSADPSGPSGIDATGFFVAGETSSPDFPTRSAIQPAPGGGKDGFLTRVASSGVIVESTYWGGSGDDAILALDTSATTCWFAGRTNSPDLRVEMPLQKKLAGQTDAFLARLNTAGIPSTVEFATYFGGSGDDEIRALRIAPDAWVWTGGNTSSPDLPLTQPSQRSLAGDSDAWIGRFHPRQNQPSLVTYFGGSGHDELTAIRHDGNGDLYTAGFTNSTDLPVRDALQDRPGGGDDGFIARFDRSGQPLMATYVGGAGNDRLRALDIAPNQAVTAAGESDSHDIPALGGPATAPNSGQLDGLLLKFHQDAIYAPDVVLGKDLIAALNVAIVSPEAAGLPITVRSTDPSRVTVNGGAFDTNTQFQLTGLASDGQVDVVVSAPGLPPRHVQVTLRPSYLVNSYDSQIQISLNSTLVVNFSFATTHPETGELIFQNVRAGLDPNVLFRSDASDIVQALGNNRAGDLSAALRGVAEGSASVAIVSAQFPVYGLRALSVRVAKPGGVVLQIPNTAVGQLLETRLMLGISPKSPPVTGPFSVRLTSEDPSKLILSAAPETVGAESITFLYTPSFGQSPSIWIQGRASSGIVRVRAEVDGADPVWANVALAPSIISIATPAESNNYGSGNVRHDPFITTVVIDIWAIRNIFDIVAGIDGQAPGGFTVPPQIPSPESPNRFSVVSSDPAVITVDYGITFNLKAAYPDYPFSPGLPKAGTTSLTLSAPGFKTAPPLEVTVRATGLPFPLPDVTLGKDLQVFISFRTPYNFPPAIPVTITSSDPSRLLVSRSQIDEAAKVVIAPIPGGSFSGDGVYISALASSGDVTVTLDAPGFPTASFVVHLVSTFFRLAPATLTTTIGDYARVNVVPSYGNDLAQPLVANLRPKLSFTFALAFSDPSVLRNDMPAVTFSGYYGYTTLVAVNEGATTVTLTSTSAAVVDPQGASANVTVTPRTFSFGQPTLILGKNLQRPLPPLAYPGPQGAITLRSLDPSRVLLSRDPSLAGGETLDTNGAVYVQGLSDSGEATIVADVPGYYEARLRIRLYPTAIAVYELYAYQNTTTTTSTIGNTVTLRVAPVLIDASSGSPIVLSDVSFRGGLDPFEVQLVSSNPAVGRLFSPISFLGGLRDNTTQFRADANGVTEISAGPPAGFVDGGPILRRRIEVTAPRLILRDVILGKDMQYYSQVSVSGPNANPASVTLTSSNPGSVLVSASPRDPGAGSAQVSSSGGGYLFYINSLAATGDVTLTATAPGFDAAMANVHLEPSYFTFYRDGSGPSVRDTAPNNSTFQRTIYVTHPSYQYSSNKSLRPGLAPLTIPVDSSDPAVVSLKSPVVFPPGADRVSVEFSARAEGTATLQVGAPDGFSLAPLADRTDKVSVDLRRFDFSNRDVGKDRSETLAYISSSMVDLPATVRLVSSDPALVLLSTDPKSPGSAELTLDLGPGLPSNTVYLYGLGAAGTATISATAPGFQASTSTVSLRPAGFAFTFSNQVTVPVGRLLTARISSGQPVRGGIAPVSVVIDNSNPAVAQLSTVTFQPGDTSQDVVITPKAPGTAILTIRDNGGAANSAVLVVTVTP